jgi:adenosylmethionine-8-amino-7-oxononanoate aminotransferase
LGGHFSLERAQRGLAGYDPRVGTHVVDANADRGAAAVEHDARWIVGDLRGEGYFYALELVRDKETKATFDDEESEKLLRGLGPQGGDALKRLKDLRARIAPYLETAE